MFEQEGNRKNTANEQLKNSNVEGEVIEIKCVFHPKQQITNFCGKIECLLPMCPSCVAIHSQEHMQQNTHGDFLNIQQVVNGIQELLLKSNKSLQELSEQYTEDFWNKQKIKESTHQRLQDCKEKLIREIERKFQAVEYRMNRKLDEFADKIHDRYKELETEIQYLYDTIKIQTQDFIPANEKLLKNVINFYAQKKEQKIAEWMHKFRTEVGQLKAESFRVKINSEVYTSPVQIEHFFGFEEFSDSENEYMISTGRGLISSDTKRKDGESQNWRGMGNESKEYNNQTVRPYSPFSYKNNKFEMSDVYQNDSFNKGTFG